MLRRHPSTFRDRFPDKFIPEPNTGCWIWTGKINNGGYGVTYLNYKAVFAHRASYEIARGQIPAGMQIDHLCRVRCCVNPDHLEIVTPKQNTQRAAAVARRDRVVRTCCKHGHELSVVGSYRRKSGTVCCKECKRESNRKRYLGASNA